MNVHIIKLLQLIQLISMYGSFELFNINVISGTTFHLKVTVSTWLMKVHGSQFIS